MVPNWGQRAALPILPNHYLLWSDSRINDLASGDEKTQWTWVPVIEPPQISGTGLRHLIRDSGTRGAREGRDDVGVTLSDSGGTKVSLGGWDGVVGGAFGGDGAQLLEVDGTVTREGVVSSLEF